VGKGKLEKRRTIGFPVAIFQSQLDEPEVAYPLESQVFGRTITAKGPAYQAGRVCGSKVERGRLLHQFLANADAAAAASAGEGGGGEGAAVWLGNADLLADAPPTMSQLKTGAKVCALPGDKNGHFHYVGSIQRIESSRIRVNFDNFAIAWRKPHEVRVLYSGHTL
jgi:hypothetical protein